jgi:ankyrin repeat protein
MSLLLQGFLLKRSATGIHAVNEKIGTTLHAAACGGQKDTVCFLLSNGIQPNICGGKYGTALPSSNAYWRKGDHTSLAQIRSRY